MPFSRELSSLPLTLSQQKCLSEKGFLMVNDINNCDSVELNIVELTKAPATKTAFQLFEEEKKMREIYSFLENLDDLLKGVLRPGLVTEFVGLPGSGRTQLSLHLSISAQIIEYSLSAETIYICTNMDFSVSRLREIIHNYRNKCIHFKDFNEDDIMKNVNFINIMSIKELLECLEYLNEFMKNKSNVSLVIIDSITYPLRFCEKSEKTSYISSIVTQLRYLGELYNFAVLLTNDMTTIVGPNGSEVVPSLRDTFYHIINNRILLSQKNNNFQAEILKCSTKFPTKCSFKFLDDLT
ncbi:DNA repair protein RAD51 homolog 3-like [Harmonia axyridis]|uniref:DNA repair protein RAD51 homolog 3-like n=1 Tax=Harmonia axyridis TaxID=115357 RepID=UPI001E27751F|nr:DNA repair protein RAD51 homolog 3-like [Harmonia axyridis]